MKSFKDHNNKTTSVGLNDKDEITFKQSQDVTDLIERNKQGIMKGFEVLDQKRFFAWLNDPEHLFFRTKKGNL